MSPALILMMLLLLCGSTNKSLSTLVPYIAKYVHHGILQMRPHAGVSDQHPMPFVALQGTKSLEGQKINLTNSTRTNIELCAPSDTRIYISCNVSSSDKRNNSKTVLKIVKRDTGKISVIRNDNSTNENFINIMDSLMEEVSVMIWDVVEKYVYDCHLVMVTSDPKQGLMPYLTRFSDGAMKPRTTFVLKEWQDDSLERKQKIWGTTLTSCRVLILELNDGDSSHFFTFLEAMSLWLWPDTKVIMIGEKSNVRRALSDDVFRNTLNVVYFGLPEALLELITQQNSRKDLWQRHLSFEPVRVENSETTAIDSKASLTDTNVSLYDRCLYCRSGFGKYRLLFLWYIGTRLPRIINIFPDQLQSFQGYKMRIVSVTFFPYMDYSLDSNESASTVTPKDCLDFRMLKAFASVLNFTYEIRAPWDMQWGNPMGNGNWTGIVGTLQHNKADFSTVMAPNSGRLTVLNHARAYVADTLVVTSLKPQPLTQYLLIIRPFTAAVWLSLVICIIIWGLVLWILQSASSQVTGNRSISFSNAFFYGLGILLEDPPTDPPINVTGQMLVGWWLVFCLVITTGFRSALVAHLTVQSKSQPIDSMQELVTQDNWHWGIEQKMLLGAALNFFKSSTDPVIQEVFEKLEIIEQEEGLKKILKGGFSFISWRNRVYTSIASLHTDDYGNTPYYIGKKGSPILTDFGWGFRKGAPFQQRFLQMMNRLIEAGIIELWNDQVMTSRVNQIREKLRGSATLSEAEQTSVVDETQIPLQVNHLLSIFLLLVVGYGIAFLLLIGEKLIYKRQSLKVKGTI